MTGVDPADEARLNTTIGSYKLLEVVGRGGHGTVFKGKHVYIAKPVAVKILHDTYARHEDAVVRFMREARAASAIKHPNIVDVADFGPVPGGGVYFVMEYLEGETLEARIARSGPIPTAAAFAIARQVASALAAAHDLKIIHRDVKPENIMLTRQPGRRDSVKPTDKAKLPEAPVLDYVKMLDFGIAKVLEAESSTLPPSGRTAAGVVFGSPSYMSPEAALGQQVDYRADIYALGIVMFDMLTGQRPFTGASSVEVMTKQIATQPPSLRQLVPGAHIPEAAEELVLKAMSKRPENRQQSMDDLIGELDAVLGALKPAPPPLSTAASKKAELKKTRAGRPSGLTGEFSNFVRESQRKMQTEKPTDPEWDALTGRIASETDDAGSDAGAGGPGKHKGK